MSKLIYLGSPYSHPSESIRHQRWIDACRAAAHLMREGHIVFSPIAHSHSVEIHGFDGPQPGDFWMAQDLPLLSRFEELMIFMLPGFIESAGIRKEKALAIERGIPISYLSPEEVGL